MQEFDHIEALWAKHTVDIGISAEEMLKQAKKDVNGMRTRSLLNIAGMVFSFLTVAAVWLIFDFQSLTTHVGISIIVIAVAVCTVILYNNHRIISNSDFTSDPNEFIKNLKRYQVNRFRLHSRLYWFYAIALSLGMALYFFEILNHMQPWAQILAIVSTFGWMIFCSTLARKAVIKRDRERISLLIEKFERISAQFHEHEHLNDETSR